MSDASKAEKIAAAKRKLEEFKQKNKAASTRSTPPSQKSASPVDSLNNISGAGEGDGSRIHESVDRLNPNPAQYFQTHNKTNGDSTSENEFVNGKAYNFFSFPNNSLNNNDNIFDNISQNYARNHEISSSTPAVSTIPFAHPIIPEKVPPVEVNSLPADNGNQSQNVISPFKDEESTLRISTLENQLSFERRATEELQRKLSESHGHILSLQQEIKRLNEEQTQRTAQEVLQLEEKLKLQLQTIEILVSEKSELQKDIFNLQDELKANNSKCEELSSRLKASRSQVQKLEKEITDRSENKSQHNTILKRLENELQQKESIVQEALHNLNEARNEKRELERRVEVGHRDLEELRRQLQEKDKLLSMAHIKLAQLGGESDGSSLREVEGLKAQVETAAKEIVAANEEKNRIEAELKQYIASLNAQVLQSNAKCERAEKDKEELEKRVRELVEHLSEVEKQLQREKAAASVRTETTAAPPPTGDLGSTSEAELVGALRQELADLQLQLSNKTEEVSALSSRLRAVEEELSEAVRFKETVPDMGLLQAAMESDRVAAARALQQNASLKQKLTELEEYILKINNSKVELTEELDKYRHMAGEYRLQLEKFKSRQEMRWVDSVTQTNLIRKAHADSQTTVEDVVNNIEPHEPVSVETLIMIEEKLKKTMDRVAQLSDEKQRLEHLVLQLQSETETIGEYVTLYQNQRSLLQEKAAEKERQVALIAVERSQLRAKLHQINALLAKFPHNPEVETTTCEISSLLGEIQASSIVQEPGGSPSSFHPCLLCSGKLINV